MQSKTGSGVLNLKNLLAGRDARTKLLVALGIAGMALILISSFWPSGGKSGTQGSTALFDADAYAADMERRVHGIISSIEGVGKAKVLVTVETSPQVIYAQQDKSTNEVQRSDGQTNMQKETQENTYVFTETESGRKAALVQTQVEPKILGVVVVCEGGGNTVIESRVTRAITTAFHISSTRVCVIKMGD